MSAGRREAVVAADETLEKYGAYRCEAGTVFRISNEISNSSVAVGLNHVESKEQWKVFTSHGPIMNETEIIEVASSISMACMDDSKDEPHAARDDHIAVGCHRLRVPNMIYGKNALLLQNNRSDLSFLFCAEDSLLAWALVHKDADHPVHVLKVPFAWKNSSKAENRGCSVSAERAPQAHGDVSSPVSLRSLEYD